jgi:hypothetical protein
VKHAGSSALDALEPLLAELRKLPLLREKARGVFYLRSRAFLHFHEDPTGLYADIRSAEGTDFDRLKLDGAGAEAALIARASAAGRPRQA